MPAKYSVHEIPGGPRLCHSEIAHSECAAVSIYIPVGSRDENGDTPNGLAHFLEHMSFKGTTTRSARDLTFELESGGGQANASTSEDHTIYEASGEADLLPVLLDTLGDMVWRSTFPNEEIQLERDVIQEEIIMIRESPSDHISDLLASALYPNHPLGNPISGTAESVKKITRKDLVNFSNQHHFRKDLVISTSGPMPIEQVLDSLNPKLPNQFHTALPDSIHQPVVPTVIHEQRNTDQLQLAMAWQTEGRRSDERHALRLLSLILGESSSSRLFQDLREERGLCYQIGSEVCLFHDTGSFQILAGLDVGGKEEAKSIIQKQITDLIHSGPSEEEVERAKKLAISQSKMAFESTAAHAAWAGEGLLFYDFIPEPASARKRLLSVKTKEVHDIAMKIFSTQPAIATISPEDHA